MSADEITVTLYGTLGRRVKRCAEQCGVTPQEWIGHAVTNAWSEQEFMGDPPSRKWTVDRGAGEKNLGLD